MSGLLLVSKRHRAKAVARSIQPFRRSRPSVARRSRQTRPSPTPLGAALIVAPLALAALIAVIACLVTLRVLIFIARKLVTRRTHS